jgi:GT2 family glycosyltransferase
LENKKIKMNITFVLAVYNKLNLTQACYNKLRDIYPDAPLVISSGGSSDGTKEWLESLEDENLSFFHDDDRLAFSETYNAGIDLVDTEKLVLIHNDMVIGEGFLEAIERLLKPNMVLSYTTIEPPIFKGHIRPGKVLLDLGTSFENFDDAQFKNYVNESKNNDNIFDGAVFFMSAYKDVFVKLNGFDGKSFRPCFCEDDDFLIRAKLAGYDLKTCDSAIVYHFVSQTSRFSDEMKDNRENIELASNRNFVRKWGIPIMTFTQMKYWLLDNFSYNRFSMGIKTSATDLLFLYEPFFDKIDIGIIPTEYIIMEQNNSTYDIASKFEDFDSVDVIISDLGQLTPEDIQILFSLRLSLPQYDPGEYQVGNLKITIKKPLSLSV